MSAELVNAVSSLLGRKLTSRESWHLRYLYSKQLTLLEQADPAAWAAMGTDDRRRRASEAAARELAEEMRARKERLQARVADLKRKRWHGPVAWVLAYVMFAASLALIAGVFFGLVILPVNRDVVPQQLVFPVILIGLLAFIVILRVFAPLLPGWYQQLVLRWLGTDSPRA